MAHPYVHAGALGLRLRDPAQTRFVCICSFFVSQAHEVGQDSELWNQILARYLILWPLYNTPNIEPWYNRLKEDIAYDLAQAAAACKRVKPYLRWEHMFALSPAQFDEVGAQMLSQQVQYERESWLANLNGPAANRDPSPGPSKNQKRPENGNKMSKRESERGPEGSGTAPQAATRVIDLSWIDDKVINLEEIDEEEL